MKHCLTCFATLAAFLCLAQPASPAATTTPGSRATKASAAATTSGSPASNASAATTTPGSPAAKASAAAPAVTTRPPADSLMQRAGTPRTVKEFLQMSPTDTTLCLLRGVVTSIRSSSGGNLFVSDGSGEVFIYGIVDPKHPGWGFRQMDIKVGDTLSLSGRRQVYKETIEMTAARLVAKSAGPDHDAPLVLDREASFKGKYGAEALEAFTSWVDKRVKYPKTAGAEQPDGSTVVMVRFVVGRNGGVQEVQATKGAGMAFNEEAVRVVRSAPKWKPAMLDGKPFRVTYTVPVTFKTR